MSITEEELRRLEELWDKKRIPVEDFGTDKRGRLIVTLEGDWKHDHVRLNWLMSEEGYSVLSEDAEDNGTDYYRSTHTFARTGKKKA